MSDSNSPSPSSSPAEPVPALQVAIVPVTPFQQNCSIVWCGRTKQAAIVDPGGDVPRIVEALEKLGVKATAIWLTHGHIDHAGGVAELAERQSLQVVGPHIGDEGLMKGLAAQGRLFGMPDARPATSDRWLVEGDTVQLGDLSFDILHVPGHSPGSVVFVHPPSRFALVGDTLFAGSIGRTDFPYGDHDLLISGIREKLIPLGDDLAFLPGHGPAGTIGEERARNPYIQG
jgi:glyoxylase-like metal-dependent hydrolase (beta-lactamase superfamily II)